MLNDETEFECEGELWLWQPKDPLSKASWHFFTIDTDTANKIYFNNQIKNLSKTRGFGSVKVKAKINDTTWETSIFPNKVNNTYLLPIKKEVRLKESIKIGDYIKLIIYLK